MQHRLLLIGLIGTFLLTPAVLMAQTRFLLAGRVTDGVSGRPLAHVSVYDIKQGLGVTTDSSGTFNLSVLRGQ